MLRHQLGMLRQLIAGSLDPHDDGTVKQSIEQRRRDANRHYRVIPPIGGFLVAYHADGHFDLISVYSMVSYRKFGHLRSKQWC
ncbi:hypothetical protein CFBP4996_25320 [Agrobacterium leguminum]|uniref:hypothetical protein n=1 Tax=Agrobacterium TaxID=357 RepID=UPI0009B9B71C|nr:MULTISPECIES: hypothetical protein [Agrobacterium]WFS69301.1 hypothetical protein CFBP4996_25320 [Agrobacterium leguminum]